MFEIYDLWEFRHTATLNDFEKIVSPRRGMELACSYYELDREKYHGRLNFELPKRKYDADRYSWNKYNRRGVGYYDQIYDEVRDNLLSGRFIAIDRGDHWHWPYNPFYFDDDSEIVYDPFMPERWDSMFHDSVMYAYYAVLERNRGIKPRPTQKIQYGTPGYAEPEQHVQSTKTLNNKNVGRLLAAGGIYNNNVDDFRKTAEQLGKETVEGYNGVMTDTNIGIGIAAASILFVKNPAMSEELSGFLGKAKGSKVFMEDVKIEEITYLRRPREEYILLRKQFDNSVRKNFMKSLSFEPGMDNYFNDSQLKLMARGGVPEPWEVHHKYPLDDSGDNGFENLILIQAQPYHGALSGVQKTITKNLKPGESIDTLWPVPNGNLFKK